jgi:uncharacterized SAM-binding protein YcdF (DUF218 family)
MSSLYNVLLKLIYPTSLAVVLLIASLVWRDRRRVRFVLQSLAVIILLACGNGAVGGFLIVELETRHPAPQPLPHADAILVLSGGVLPRVAPRATVEVGEAGDRILYSAQLYKNGYAPEIICTGNVMRPGARQRSTAEEMAELLTTLGVPGAAIVIEGGSGNTHEHAVNLCPMLTTRGTKSVLLVTSAMHMPRSLRSFRRVCPAVTFIPTPTDYRATEEARPTWYQRLVGFIPTPANFVNFSDAAHEYLGLVYYWMRGWI